MTNDFITVKGVFKGCTILSEDGVKYYLQVYGNHPIRTGFFLLHKHPGFWAIANEITEVQD